MTYKDTIAIVYRVIGAYPFYTRQFSDEMIEDMIREWHEAMKSIPRDGAMEAVTALITEQKWMPSLSEVMNRILDTQYGSDAEIIRDMDRAIEKSSTCIIFGQVTEEQKQGYEKLTPFQKLIIQSPYEFNLWLNKDYEWKEERVRRIKREVSYGKHTDHLSDAKQEALGGFNVLKALEERRSQEVAEWNG